MKTLKEVRRELDIISSDIMGLQEKKSALLREEQSLREQEQGLVPGETMVREINHRGEPDRLGQFVKYYYAKYHKSDWAKVLLVNKDGKVGLRMTTFYKWEKEAA